MRLTITLKPINTFTVINGISLANATLGITSLGSLDKSMHAMIHRPVRRLRLVRDPFIGLLMVVRDETNTILAKTPEDIQTWGKHIAGARKLVAERSQTAAFEISTMASQTVKVGQQAGEMLTRLVPDIKKTAELVAEISAACRERDVGGEANNQAIQRLGKVTQQNASTLEQMPATFGRLAAQSEQLQSSIPCFGLEAAAGRRHLAPRAAVPWTKPGADGKRRVAAKPRPAKPGVGFRARPRERRRRCPRRRSRHVLSALTCSGQAVNAAARRLHPGPHAAPRFPRSQAHRRLECRS
jgi:hypothetical protein